jgi:hypothetical protein
MPVVNNLPNPLYVGTAATSTVSFANPGESPADPTTVTLKFRTNLGTVTTWVYLGAGSIVRSLDGEGNPEYSAEIPNASPGEVTGEWIGTGAVAATEPFSYPVEPLPM